MTAVITSDASIKKPTRATKLSVGLDFYSPGLIKILPRNCVKIDLRFQIKAPESHFTMLRERSSLSLKNIICTGGIIDPDYLGNVYFILHNLSGKTYVIQKGEKIGQMIFLKSCYPKILTIRSFGAENANKQMSELKYLREERGARGFGSSNEIEGENKIINLPESQKSKGNSSKE